MTKYISTIGQDSHRFLTTSSTKKCVLGGVEFLDVPGMDADSDGDVVLHSICNAITGISHVPILGKVAIELCHEQNITDSKIYVEHALKTLKNTKIEHISLTIEGKRPRMQKFVDKVRKSVADLLSISIDQVGITVTSGDHLSDFARGDGLQCFCIATFAVD